MKLCDKLKNILGKILYKKSNWSIGLYQASKENHLITKNIPNIQNPVISYKNITDLNASFVADPFLVKEKGKYYLFFEIKDKDLNRGVIGVATSDDGINFKYEKVVLKEDYHLSYPFVFKIENQWYMIPEIGESGEVRLYKSKNFPFEWEFEKTLLNGKNFVDATILNHNGLWYIFVSDNTHTLLEIYYSENFDGLYKPHSQNPIYKNKKVARPAGPFLKYKNKIYRFSQDCSKRYGEKVNIFEVLELTPETYREKFVKILFEPEAGINWNARKMHHVCYLEEEDRFLIATDAEGYSKD